MMYIIYCYLEKHKNCLFDTNTAISNKLKNGKQYILLWILLVF